MGRGLWEVHPVDCIRKEKCQEYRENIRVFYIRVRMITRRSNEFYRERFLFEIIYVDNFIIVILILKKFISRFLELIESFVELQEIDGSISAMNR